MPKFSPEMPIHIWFTLAKFHFDWIKISKVIKNFRYLQTFWRNLTLANSSPILLWSRLRIRVNSLTFTFWMAKIWHLENSNPWPSQSTEFDVQILKYAKWSTFKYEFGTYVPVEMTCKVKGIVWHDFEIILKCFQSKKC